MRVRRRVSISRKRQSGARLAVVWRARMDAHLKLASEVVSEQAGEHVELVAHPGLDRHVVHLAVRFEFGEDALLGASTFVEQGGLA